MHSCLYIVHSLVAPTPVHLCGYALTHHGCSQPRTRATPPNLVVPPSCSCIVLSLVALTPPLRSHISVFAALANRWIILGRATSTPFLLPPLSCLYHSICLWFEPRGYKPFILFYDCLFFFCEFDLFVLKCDWISVYHTLYLDFLWLKCDLSL